MFEAMGLARAVTLFAAGAATALYLNRRPPAVDGRFVPSVPDASRPAPPQEDPVGVLEDPPDEEAPGYAFAEEPEAPLEDVEAFPEEPEDEEIFVDAREELWPEPPPAPPPPSPGASRRGPPPVPGVEQPTVEQPAIERGALPADVAAVVDDLIASEPPEEDMAEIVDAEVVDELEPPESPDDARIAVAVLVELGKVPGLDPNAVGVEVTDGVVRLHGEIDDPVTLAEVERRIAALDVVGPLTSLLRVGQSSHAA